ncbi:hypothetical protein VTO73DRAFT_13222 [Trametes versicolor]
MASLASSLAGQGSHFTLSTTVSIPDPAYLEGRTLHVVYDLDPHVYADQYELAQRPGYSSVLWGTADLEKPVSAVDADGSVLLLTADASQLSLGQAANITLEVPLHARYGRPKAGASAHNATYSVSLKRPVGFFALDVNSVAEIPLTLRPYASLTGWPTSPLSLIPDIAANEPLDVVIPVGALDDLAWVDVGTAAVMLAMFFYLFHASIRTARRLSSRASTKTD